MPLVAHFEFDGEYYNFDHEPGACGLGGPTTREDLCGP